MKIARFLTTGLCIAWLSVCANGCNKQALEKDMRADSGVAAGGLTPGQAAMVLAKVGDTSITLGEFAETLERMDQFDRLRYQTPERRKELLDEMITVELLAREAKRRGLDQQPEMQEGMRQVLRDALLRDLRKGAKDPTSFSQADVQAYFDAHQDDFSEPERRRISCVVVADKATAEKILAQAKDLTPQKWGELVTQHSLAYKKTKYTGPIESAGDLGLVGPPGHRRGANPRVDEAVRAAAFEIAKEGETAAKPIQDKDGTWNIIRLTSKTAAHTRSLSEAERTIRIKLSQQEISKAEKALEDELRKKFPVTVDEGVLSNVKVPDPAPTPPAAPEDHDVDHDHGAPPMPVPVPRPGHGHNHNHGH